MSQVFRSNYVEKAPMAIAKWKVLFPFAQNRRARFATSLLRIVSIFETVVN